MAHEGHAVREGDVDAIAGERRLGGIAEELAVLVVQADELLDVFGDARGYLHLADVVVEDLVDRLAVLIAAPHGDRITVRLEPEDDGRVSRCPRWL